MTITEARSKGILQDKIVYLRMIPKANPLTNDPNNPAYGGFDGSLTVLTIGCDDKGRLVNPFKDDDELKFFESVTKQNLSVYMESNPFWEKYTYNVIKDPLIIRMGKKLDLSDPNDALAYRVLLTNKKIVCPSMEEYKEFPSPFYKFIMVDEGYEELRVNKELDVSKRVYMFLGRIEDNPAKMRSFLNIYYTTNMKTNRATESLSKETLIAELGKLIETDRKGFVEVMDDPNFDTKALILDAIAVGAVEKDGFTYRITGERAAFNFHELVTFIKDIAAREDLLYSRIVAQIRNKNS